MVSIALTMFRRPDSLQRKRPVGLNLFLRSSAM